MVYSIYLCMWQGAYMPWHAYRVQRIVRVFVLSVM